MGTKPQKNELRHLITKIVTDLEEIAGLETFLWEPHKLASHFSLPAMGLPLNQAQPWLAPFAGLTTPMFVLGFNPEPP